MERGQGETGWREAGEATPSPSASNNSNNNRRKERGVGERERKRNRETVESNTTPKTMDGQSCIEKRRLIE